jgi:hypothetical protein
VCADALAALRENWLEISMAVSPAAAQAAAEL